MQNKAYPTVFVPNRVRTPPYCFPTRKASGRTSARARQRKKETVHEASFFDIAACDLSPQECRSGPHTRRLLKITLSSPNQFSLRLRYNFFSRYPMESHATDLNRDTFDQKPNQWKLRSMTALAPFPKAKIHRPFSPSKGARRFAGSHPLAKPYKNAESPCTARVPNYNSIQLLLRNDYTIVPYKKQRRKSGVVF